MAERPAVNASPLIFLAGAELLDLLRLTGDQVIVPTAVAEEIKQRGPTDITARAIIETAWLLITETPSIPAIIHAWGLGAGEASVLAWAYTHSGTEAIMDDLAGRRCAAALGIPVRGTLGLVLVAKQRQDCICAFGPRSIAPIGHVSFRQCIESGAYSGGRVNLPNRQAMVNLSRLHN